MKIRDFYRKKCDELFDPRQINNEEDDEAVLEYCKKLMNENGIANEGLADEDDWLEFVYRAGEILEIEREGYCYRHENGSYELMPAQGDL